MQETGKHGLQLRTKEANDYQLQDDSDVGFTRLNFRGAIINILRDKVKNMEELKKIMS